MSEKKENPNRRFVGKIKQMSGQYGNFQKVLIDNPSPVEGEGENQTPNKYYQGNLIWLDAATGRRYVIKQLSVRGVSQAQAGRGFIGSLSIDLDDAYEVEDKG